MKNRQMLRLFVSLAAVLMLLEMRPTRALPVEYVSDEATSTTTATTTKTVKQTMTSSLIMPTPVASASNSSSTVSASQNATMTETVNLTATQATLGNSTLTQAPNNTTAANQTETVTESSNSTHNQTEVTDTQSEVEHSNTNSTADNPVKNETSSHHENILDKANIWPTIMSGHGIILEMKVSVAGPGVCRQKETVETTVHPVRLARRAPLPIEAPVGAPEASVQGIDTTFGNWSTNNDLPTAVAEIVADDNASKTHHSATALSVSATTTMESTFATLQTSKSLVSEVIATSVSSMVSATEASDSITIASSSATDSAVYILTITSQSSVATPTESHEASEHKDGDKSNEGEHNNDDAQKPDDKTGSDDNDFESEIVSHDKENHGPIVCNNTQSEGEDGGHASSVQKEGDDAEASHDGHASIAESDNQWTYLLNETFSSDKLDDKWKIFKGCKRDNSGKAVCYTSRADNVFVNGTLRLTPVRQLKNFRVNFTEHKRVYTSGQIQTKVDVPKDSKRWRLTAVFHVPTNATKGVDGQATVTLGSKSHRVLGVHLLKGLHKHYNASLPMQKVLIDLQMDLEQSKMTLTRTFVEEVQSRSLTQNWKIVTENSIEEIRLAIGAAVKIDEEVYNKWEGRSENNCQKCNESEIIDNASANDAEYHVEADSIMLTSQ